MIDEEKSSATAVELGKFLRELREARKFSLRDVEQITGSKISNAYLSQLENGQIKRPSAAILHTVAAAYGVDYALILQRAGLAPEPSKSPRASRSVLGDLTPGEESELLRYLAFLRQRPKS
jgi:HTH-type transcriptional regulator, competence development regulator